MQYWILLLSVRIEKKKILPLLDEQVALSAGPTCSNVLRVVTSQLEALVLGGNTGVAAETRVFSLILTFFSLFKG
jgi:hypothetical protein